MALKTHKPITPGRRGLVLVDRAHLWKGKPVKTLTEGLISKGGRNNTGRITARRKEIARIMGDHLSRGINHIDVEHMGGRRGRSGKTYADLTRFAPSDPGRGTKDKRRHLDRGDGKYHRLVWVQLNRKLLFLPRAFAARTS